MKLSQSLISQWLWLWLWLFGLPLMLTQKSSVPHLQKQGWDIAFVGDYILILIIILAITMIMVLVIARYKRRAEEALCNKRRAEEELSRASDLLESQVEQHTAKLTILTDELHGEIIKRQQVEQALRESEMSCRRLIKELEAIRLTERMRIARDIHDSLGQDLGYLHLKLDGMATEYTLQPPEKRQNELIQMRDVAHSAYEKVRELLADIFSSSSSCLSDTLQKLSSSINERNQFAIQFVESGSPAMLSTALQEQVVCICREALTNIEKHARAQQVKVTLLWAEGLSITITDDGRGFDVEAVPSNDHFGLQIMAIRAEQIGAEFSLHSALSLGTTMTLNISRSNLS